MGRKMKGLMKGFRYISQIFEEDKEPEMQIGLPTDVKHVAHIGWDGPSVNSPSWMTNFKSDPDFASSGLTLPEDASSSRDLPPIKPPSEDSSGRRSRRASESATRDLPDLPKATRRHTSSNGGTMDSAAREKSEKRHSKRHQSGDESRLDIGGASPSHNQPDIPKKSRRKKTTKDSSVGGSTRSTQSSSKARAADASSCGYPSPYSDPGTCPLPGSGLMDDSFSDSPSRNLQPLVTIEGKVKMTNFKSDPDFASSGLTLPEDASRDLPQIKPPSEDSSSRRSRRASESTTRDLPDLPKATRRHTSSNGGTTDSTVREKSEKRHSRRHQSGDESRLDIGGASPSHNLPDIPKKSRRKKTTKDTSVGGSTRSTRSSSKAGAAGATSGGYASPYSDPGTCTLPGSGLMDDSFSDSPSRNLQPFGQH